MVKFCPERPMHQAMKKTSRAPSRSGVLLARPGGGLIDRESDRRQRGARFGGLLYVGGGHIGATTLWMFPDRADRVTSAATSALALVAGLLLPLLPWGRWPNRALLAFPIAGHAFFAATWILVPAAETHYVALLVLAYLHLGLTQPPRTALFVLPLSIVTVEIGKGPWTVTTLIVLVVAVVAAESLAHYVTRDREASEDVSQLLRATRRLAAATNVQDSADILAEEVTHFLHADLVLVYTAAGPDHPDEYVNRTNNAHYGPMPINVTGEPSGVGTTIRSGQALFIPDAPYSPVVSNRLVTATGTASALYLPLPGLDTTVGVLAVGWTQPLDTIPALRTSIVEILATDAGRMIERHTHAQQLATQAITDPLTGIGNRRQWQLHTTPGTLDDGDAVVIIDLDHFKSLNDTCGHDHGDRTLIEFAACLATAARHNDHVHRLGGDEFGLILRGAHADGVPAFLDRLATIWSAAGPSLTYSAGWARHHHNQPPDTTITDADHALYQAKHHGRNRAHGPTTNTTKTG